MNLNKEVLNQLESHALGEPAREVCGFIYSDFYYPLRNLATDPRTFYADPADIAYALAHFGEPEAIFHTHPAELNTPSAADIQLSYYDNSTIIIGTIECGKLKLSEYSTKLR